MDTNTKQTPKSCSCSCCRRGKHTPGGHVMRKYDNRAYRRAAKIQIKTNELDNIVLDSGPIGNYYD